MIPYFHIAKRRLLLVVCMLLLINICMYFPTAIKYKQLPQNFPFKQLQSLKQFFGIDSFSMTNSNKCLSFAKKLTNVTKGSFGIPMIIHQVYASTNLPSAYMDFLTKCRYLNEDFLHVLWTNADFTRFLRRERPEWLPTFNSFDAELEKSDVMRLMILQHYGGIYMDLDVECHRPLSHYLRHINSSLIFDQERSMQSFLLWKMENITMNSVIISRPDHPFLQLLIDKLSVRGSLDLEVMLKTGPLFLRRQFRDYVKLKRQKREDKIEMVPSDHFSPLLDNSAFDIFNHRCPVVRSRACKEWIRQGRTQNAAKEILDRKSFLAHHFLHIGHIGSIDNKTVDVCKTSLGISRYLDDHS